MKPVRVEDGAQAGAQSTCCCYPYTGLLIAVTMHGLMSDMGSFFQLLVSVRGRRGTCASPDWCRALLMILCGCVAPACPHCDRPLAVGWNDGHEGELRWRPCPCGHHSPVERETDTRLGARPPSTPLECWSLVSSLRVMSRVPLVCRLVSRCYTRSRPLQLDRAILTDDVFHVPLHVRLRSAFHRRGEPHMSRDV